MPHDLLLLRQETDTGDVCVQKYCGKEGIKPITCPEQYKAIMEWGVDYYKSNLSGYHHWMCFRSTMMHLCHFYGDLP